MHQSGPHGEQLVDASFLTWFNASAEPLDLVLPENDWAQRGSSRGRQTPPSAWDAR